MRALGGSDAEKYGMNELQIEKESAFAVQHKNSKHTTQRLTRLVLLRVRAR